jgi:hypothetical protein
MTSHRTELSIRRGPYRTPAHAKPGLVKPTWRDTSTVHSGELRTHAEKSEARREGAFSMTKFLVSIQVSLLRMCSYA